MKILILLFIFYVNYCTCQYVSEDPKKTASLFPKKVRPGMVQYNNAGKYVKIPTTKNQRRNPSSPREYTAFARPFPGSEEFRAHHQIVPDSPYFPVDEPTQPERRSRVKKVLPEYPLPPRHKRSADDKVAVKHNVVKVPTVSSSIDQKVGNPPKSLIADDATSGTKKIKAPAKRVSGKGDNLRAKKRRQDRTGKKAVRVPLSDSAAKSKKRIAPQHDIQRQAQEDGTDQKLSQPEQRKLKKLKSSKKIARSNRVSRKLKGKVRHDRRQNPHKSLKANKNKSIKRTALGHRSNTSKNRASGKSKGRKRIARRLIAARDATIEEYPYTISIQKDGTHWCSGAILNPRLIITTANCLWRSNSITRLRVRVGSRHTDRGGQVARIQEVMKHPSWKIRKNPDNDVALALLDKNIRFSHGVHGVDLPNRAMLPPFDDAWITSWGSERRDGIFDSRSVNLQVYHARLIDREQCNNITHRYAVSVTENFICLAQTGSRAPCTRDTGAPAVSDGILWGLASWGIRKLCGTERFPAMFSYTASPGNMEFIINATHYLMAEERMYPFLDRYPIQRVSITAPTQMTLPY